MLWHSLESQTSINSNIFRLQTSLIITACCFVISFQAPEVFFLTKQNLCKINGHLLLRDSKDPLVSSTQPALKAGRWSVGKAVKIAESEVRVKAMMGPPQFGKAGLGLSKAFKLPQTNQ